MKTIIVVTGKTNTTVQTDIPITVFDDTDTSKFYNILLELFPDNDWDDFCCDTIEYHDDHIKCAVSTI